MTPQVTYCQRLFWRGRQQAWALTRLVRSRARTPSTRLPAHRLLAPPWRAPRRRTRSTAAGAAPAARPWPCGSAQRSSCGARWRSAARVLQGYRTLCRNRGKLVRRVDRARFVSRSLGASPAGALMQGSRRNGLSGSSLASSTLQLLLRCRIDALWAVRLRSLWMDGHMGRGRGYGTGW